MWADTMDYEYGIKDVQVFGVALIWRGTSDLKALAKFKIEVILYYEREQLHDSKL